MKHSQYDIHELNAQSKGIRTLMLLIVLVLIIALAVFGAIEYWKVTVEVEPEVPAAPELPVREIPER